MEKNKIKFNLPKDHFLVQFDDLSWAVTKKMNNPKYPFKTLGYYPTLIAAYNDAIDILSLQATNLLELRQIIKELQEIKIKISEPTNI